jgi:hypothetical protein
VFATKICEERGREEKFDTCTSMNDDGFKWLRLVVIRTGSFDAQENVRKRKEKGEDGRNAKAEQAIGLQQKSIRTDRKKDRRKDKDGKWVVLSLSLYSAQSSSSWRQV